MKRLNSSINCLSREEIEKQSTFQGTHLDKNTIVQYEKMTDVWVNYKNSTHLKQYNCSDLLKFFIFLGLFSIILNTSN